VEKLSLLNFINLLWNFLFFFILVVNIIEDIHYLLRGRIYVLLPYLGALILEIEETDVLELTIIIDFISQRVFADGQTPVERVLFAR
jgi:hypothetical protein